MGLSDREREKNRSFFYKKKQQVKVFQSFVVNGVSCERGAENQAGAEAWIVPTIIQADARAMNESERKTSRADHARRHRGKRINRVEF